MSKNMETGMTNPITLDSAFLRILSHQLKTPIGAIQSMLKTVADGFTGEVNPQALRFIEKAIAKASEADSLIADLLAYQVTTKQEAGDKVAVDIVGLVDTLVSKYSGAAAEHNILLKLIAPEGISIIVMGDARGLEIALRNLIENAMKYTPANGEVIVRVNAVRKRHICQVSVADSGYGIAKDDLRHIFDPFYRSIKIKATVSGTGLGLAITKNIITGHNGTIAVSSKENKGTVIRVGLPYTRITRRHAHDARKKRVVIIGGVTAGPKAAARLRRLDEDMDITIIEKG
jgi:signal transduction histidine kinase